MTQQQPPPSETRWAFGAGVALSLGTESLGRVELVHPFSGDHLGPPSYQVCVVETEHPTHPVAVLYHSSSSAIIVRRNFSVDEPASSSPATALYAELEEEAGVAMTSSFVGSQLVTVLDFPADDLGVSVLVGNGPFNVGSSAFTRTHLGIPSGAKWASFAALPAVDGLLPVLAAAYRPSTRGSPGDPTGLEMYLFTVNPWAVPGPDMLAAPAVPVTATPPFLPHAALASRYFDAHGRRLTALFVAGRSDAESGSPSVATVSGSGALTPSASDGVWRSDSDPPISWTLVRRSPWSQGHARLEELGSPYGGATPAAGKPTARDLGLAYDAKRQQVVVAGVGPDPTSSPSRARPRYIKP